MQNLQQAEVPVITIDGPSGSGKGTIGRLLAQELSWHFLDSGALYRILALAAQQNHVSFGDEKQLAVLAGKLDVRFGTEEKEKPIQVFLAGQDVTDSIRSETCGSNASKIASLARVRAALLERQRAFKEPPGLVTDGRDMGSVVFPDAKLKFFLMASAQERAIRRYNQLKQAGINVSLGALLEELIIRDKRDQERSVSPLKPTADAIILDTTGLSIEQVLEQVRTKIREIFILA